jgi:uncharacterized phiE125 gp8 family phage protein
MIPATVRKIAEPTIEPVSLADVKAQLSMLADQTEFDAFLVDKIGTARELVEARLGRTIYASRYRARWTEETKVLTLPYPPLLVDEDHPLVVTCDGDAVPAEDLEVDADAWPGKVTISGSHYGVKVAQYWAGVPEGSRISRRIHSAILLYAVHMFENRGVLARDSSVELPQAWETLLASESHSGGW